MFLGVLISKRCTLTQALKDFRIKRLPAGATLCWQLPLLRNELVSSVVGMNIRKTYDGYICQQDRLSDVPK